MLLGEREQHRVEGEPEKGFAANPALALSHYFLDEMREEGREGRKSGRQGLLHSFKGESIVNSRMQAKR